MDLKFLDLNGLTESEKLQIKDILRCDSNIIENNANSVQATEMSMQIQNNGNTWYAAMPQYQQPIITNNMCNEWQSSTMYNVSTNGHIQPFMPGMAYPQSECSLTPEMHGVNYCKDNGRRSGRVKNLRKDNYNHTYNNANEIQSGYVNDQGFHQPMPVVSTLYIYPEHHSVPAQQHPVTGQLYYAPTIYPYAVHQTYSAHHPTSENRFIQQPLPNQNLKPSTTKSYDKLAQQSTHTPAKSTGKQISRNEEKPIYANASNGEVQSINTTTEHNVTCTTVNDNSKITDTKVNNVNINDSNEPSEEIVKKATTTIVSSFTTVENTAPVPTSMASKSEENIPKNTTDDISTKTPNDSSTASSIPVSAPEPETTHTANRLWSSLFHNAEPKVSSSSRTTACNVPVHQNGISKAVEKETVVVASIPAVTRPNASSNTPVDYKTLQNGILENFYDDPNLFRMGEFLLHYKMDMQTVSLIPRGLTNRNNYCYVNSILQALLACPLFYNLFKALPHPNNYNKHNKHSTIPSIDSLVRFIREFTPLPEGARLPRKDRANKRDDVIIENGVALEPSYVYTMLRCTSSAGVFPVEGRQEDAEEFLSYLLNAVNDEMIDLIKLVSSEQNMVSNVENVNHNNEEEEWRTIGPKNKGSITRCIELDRTPLSDIFRGKLRSRVSRAGEQPTDNVQPFFTLQLDIEKAESVKHALELLVGKDRLEGVTCTKTKQQIEAWKQVTLEELPAVLILHLKWFVYKYNGCSKILKSVEFPVDLKIDNKLLSSNTAKKLNAKQKQYKLFAITYHDGKEATKGHYVTDAFHVGYGGWIRYDDSSTKAVPESNVLKPTPPRVPYLLYYRRCDTIRNNQLNKLH